MNNTTQYFLNWTPNQTMLDCMTNHSMMSSCGPVEVVLHWWDWAAIIIMSLFFIWFIIDMIRNPKKYENYLNEKDK